MQGPDGKFVQRERERSEGADVVAVTEVARGWERTVMGTLALRIGCSWS